MAISEFDRVARAGDFMTGDLDIRDLLLKFTDGAGVDKARLRRNGSDLEFWDETLSAWVKLSDLILGGLVNDLYEVQTATAAQKVFTLTTGTYNVGLDCLQVIIDGQWLDNAYFTEDSTTQVTLNGPLSTPPLPDLVGGERVTFLVPRGRAIGGFDLDFTQAYTVDTTGPATLLNYTWPSGARYLLISVGGEGKSLGSGEFTIDLTSNLLYGAWFAGQTDPSETNYGGSAAGVAPLGESLLETGAVVDDYVKISAYDAVLRNIQIEHYSNAVSKVKFVSIRAMY